MENARIKAYDPAVKNLPLVQTSRILLTDTYESALKNSDAAVIATNWTEFKKLKPKRVVLLMRSPVVLDPNRFLRDGLARDPQIRYLTVGKAA